MIGCQYLDDTKFEQSLAVARKYVIFFSFEEHFLKTFEMVVGSEGKTMEFCAAFAQLFIA